MGRDCRFRIVEASRDKDGDATLSEKQAGKLLDEIKAAAQKRTKDGTDIEDALVAELTERKINAKREGELQKRNALINIVKHKELTAKIDDFVLAGLSPKKAFQAITVGVQSNVKDGRFSIDAQQKTIHGQFLGALTKKLEEEDLLPVFNQKALQSQIEDDLWQLSLGKKGVSGSKQAGRIAQIIHEVQDSARIRTNRAGAQIDKLETFTATQTHSSSAMVKAGKNEWMATIEPLLDRQKTFQGADAGEFLSKTYDALSTGIHLKSQGVDDGKLFQFKGPSNLAKRSSQRRVLHFKDSESARAYRQKFGNRDFLEGMLLGLEKSSRDIALMETLGTNPEAMFNTLLDDARTKFRGDPEKIKGLQNERPIRNFFDEVTGATMIPGNVTSAQIGSVLRALQSMSKLGGALLSSFADIPLKAAELQFQGFDILNSYGITLKDIGRVLPNSERRQLASAINVGMDGMVGAVAARFTATDNLPGKMSKLQRLFFKLNGLTWWTESSKIGTGIAMSHRLAQQKASKFSDLGVDTQRIFGTFGIDAADWDKIRKSKMTDFNGSEHITTDAIADLPDNLFKNPSERDKLQSKLGAYFTDRVDAATLTPDARERAILTQGTRRGTIEGELLRFATQFKSFPVTVLSKVYGRALYGKGRADVPAMIQTAIMTTAIGYLAMSAKDISKGREPRDPKEVKTWEAAFLQGGGAGILGDFILGDYNRFGGGLTATLAGPTASTMENLAQVYAAAKDGKDPSAKALNTLINNAPFANLFYVRPALNYMFIYQLQEQLNPGYLRRMERRVKKDNNQKFIFRPSDFAG